MRLTAVTYLLLVAAAALPLRAQVPTTSTVPTPDQMQARAACLGLTVQEYHDYYYPTDGAVRYLTKDEGKRRDAVAKKLAKVPRERVQECDRQRMTEDASAIMGGMQQKMNAMEEQVAKGGHGMTEAPGRSARLSDDPAADLKEGRTAVHDIDWVAGQGTVSVNGMESYRKSLAQLAPLLVAAGGRFTVDFYLDTRYTPDALGPVADMRMKTLRDALPGLSLRRGKVARDADARIEFVVAK